MWSRTPIEILLLRASTGAPTTNNIALSMQLKRKMIQARILVLRTKVEDHMRKSQTQYTYDYDRRVGETPHFTPITCVFLDGPPLRAKSNCSVKSVLEREYSVLRTRASGHLCIVGVQEDTSTIDAISIPKTVSTNRLTHASRAALPLRVSNELSPTLQRHREEERDLTNNE